uniref:BRCA2-interacting transcriptional repressor EMSY-like n=1 Tax=Cyprinus carpio TaxID=7962 RepID=A0A8C1Y4A1_CYPCA
MPVVWPTLLDLSRDECKRILRKLELEAYAGVISALRAQGDLTKDKKDLLGELTRVLSMSGPNSSSEWSIEGRRLVPLMPRLVPQTAFTVMANAVASATAHQNASLLLPADTANKEGVSCSDEDEKPRKRRRTNSSSSSPMLLKEVPKVATPISKTITVPVSGSPKMSNLMQSIANSLPPHMSPVKITFTKPCTQTTNSTTQKVIIVTTSPSSNFVPNILSKSHNYAAVSKLVSSAALSASSHKQTMVLSAGPATALGPSHVAVTTTVSSTPSVVMSTIAQGGSSAAVKLSSTRLPSPKSLVSSPSQILQIPKAQQQTAVQAASPKGLQASLSSPQSSAAGAKPTIQIKQESGVKIITQQMQPSKILPKPSSAALPSSSSAPIMVVSSNGAIMTTKLVSTPTGSQASYTRPSVSPAIGARVATSPAGATYVKTTSGSIITVVPKSLATLGGKILTTNMVSGTSTKITTIPMTSKPNVIVVQKTTGKGTTIQGLPGKNVVTTLLNAGGEKTLQAVPGAKPAIITASRPITKMIVAQPKSLGAGVQPSTKIIPTKIVYGQQGKTQVLIKPKPMAFQTAVVSEQTRQLVSETLQQVSRSAEPLAGSGQDGPYTESSPAASDSTHGQQITASEFYSSLYVLLNFTLFSINQTTELCCQMDSKHSSVVEGVCVCVCVCVQVEVCVPQVKPLQEQVVVDEGELEGDTLDPQTGLFYRSSQQHRSPPPKPAAGPPDTPTSSKRAESLTARVSVQRASASAALVSSNPPHTPQLPKLQQAPSSHNRPNTHTQLSQPPPLQAHHPVGSSKTPGSSQVRPVIPQYSIMPDSSQSNVVVEPSGFLEISDYTSQRLDEEAAMEQEVDSSNDEGAAASPTADQSQ